jgi:hypothetical protein
MKLGIHKPLALGLLMLAPPLLAENVQESERIVCSPSTAVLCVETGDCFGVLPYEIDLPQFILVDARKRVLSTTKLSNRPRTTEIDNFTRQDGRILMQGIEEGRAYSLSIEQDLGMLTGVMAKDGVTVSVFGVCTDADLE